MKMLKLSLGYFLVIILFISNNAFANVVISSTRIIYDASKKEATIQTENLREKPSLVQVWIDDGDASVAAKNSASPFVITPPLIRLEPNAGQMFRIIYIPNQINLPQDKESVFYFNLLDIPPSPDEKNGDEVGESYLQFAYRSRIKLFYRPAALPDNVFDSVKKLSWELNKNDGKIILNAKNDSSYHISFATIKLDYNGQEYDVQSEMLPPKESMSFHIKNFPENVDIKNVKINFSYVNDYGALIKDSYSF